MNFYQESSDYKFAAPKLRKVLLHPVSSNQNGDLFQ